MAQCIWCEKSGVFLKVNHAGLCKNCVTVIGNTADSLAQTIDLNQNRIKTATSIGSAVAGRKTIENSCEALRQYEEKGIEVFNIPLGELFNDAGKDCNKKIAEIAKASLGRDLIKLESAKTDKTFHKYYEEFLEKVDQAIEEVEPVENYQKTIDILNAVRKQFEINFNYRFK